VLAVISITLGGSGIAFLLMEKGVKEVSCCQGMAFKETASVIRDFRLVGILGSDLRIALSQTAALAAMAMLFWTALRPRLLPLALSPLAALFHLFMALATVQADLAPAYTGKADHHCLYCIPAGSGAATGLFALGLALLVLAALPPILYSWYRFLLRDDESEHGRGPRILWASLAAVAIFWGLALGSRA
jgi:hypothetical protein